MNLFNFRFSWAKCPAERKIIFNYSKLTDPWDALRRAKRESGLWEDFMETSMHFFGESKRSDQNNNKQLNLFDKNDN